MRVFLSTTPSELAPQRAAAERVVRELGWEPVSRAAGDGRQRIEDALSDVGRSDLVLALIGWSRGPVPDPEAGGDGLRPWAHWEVEGAFRRGRPAVVLMASEAWPAREESSEGRAIVADLRAELAPLAVPFDPEAADAPRFAAALRKELDGRSRSEPDRAPSASDTSPTSPSQAGLVLRVWPPPELPPRPWPVLLPYAHPDLLAGREREVRELTELLERPLPILGLHATSGSGKSSLLLGGLVPSLRKAGRAAVLDRHPAEPGLASRLVGDLLDGPADALQLEDADHETFVARIRTARRRSGDRPPVIVLDQLEDVLRGDRRVRAAVGSLLAATVRRRPGIDGPLCRWLLAYRREAHGPLLHWLEDPLREARALGMAAVEDLPHDLASVDRFHAWPLPPLGSAPAGAPDPEAIASRTFLAALTTPLALRDEAGLPVYRFRFAGDGAERLARAFGEARAAQPAAPLAPELQVVLARIVETAGEPAGPDEPVTLVVPDDPARLIDDALEEHLIRALDAAFLASDRIGRTRALLALRELADAQGRRGPGRSDEDLTRAIGREGREVLEKLQSPQCRLVVASRHGDEPVFTLSHDRLAEVIVRAVDAGGAGGRLAVDARLLSLRRFVALQTGLYQSGERDQATRVSPRNAAGIEANADTLLADDERRRWWRACQARRARDRKRSAAAWTSAVVVGLLLAFSTWTLVARRAARTALLEEIAHAEAEPALAAVLRALDDPSIGAERVRAMLKQRPAPLDVLDRGLGIVPAARRGEAVLEVASIALPIVDASDDDVPLGSLLWALDYGPGRIPALAGRAGQIRERALASTRRLHAPPAANEDEWVEIPAGTFRMGSERNGGGDDEKPVRDVTLSAFRALDHEVTNAEYRRLRPDHEGADTEPARDVSWYSAYVYSAWLGGRLPTEAEWEYMARAGCRFERCRRDGTEASVRDVAWSLASILGTGGEPRLHPVKGLSPNPWGLYDTLGNLWEWTADWYGPYAAGSQVDPWGPTRGSTKSNRGGCYRYGASDAHPAYRGASGPELELSSGGFRPIIPATSRPDGPGASGAQPPGITGRNPASSVVRRGGV